MNRDEARAAAHHLKRTPVVDDSDLRVRDLAIAYLALESELTTLRSQLEPEDPVSFGVDPADSASLLALRQAVDDHLGWATLESEEAADYPARVHEVGAELATLRSEKERAEELAQSPRVRLGVWLATDPNHRACEILPTGHDMIGLHHRAQMCRLFDTGERTVGEGPTEDAAISAALAALEKVEGQGG